MADNIRPAGIFDTRYEDDLALNRTAGDKVRVYYSFLLLLAVPLFVAEGALGHFADNIPLVIWVIAAIALFFALRYVKQPIARTAVVVAIAVLTVFIINSLLASLGWAIPGQWLSIITQIAIFVIAAQGLNILVGYTGQISLGQAAFMAVGAYSTALMAKGFPIYLGETVMQIGPFPFWLALPLGAIFTGVVGLIFGLPSLRVKGFYLAMATLAAQFIIPWIIENPLQPWTNAPQPLQDIPAPALFGMEFAGENEWAMYMLIIILAVFLMLIARNIIRSRVGRAFVSIRDNDLAAELLGINVFWYKLQAFFISAVFAGIAGGLLAYERNTIAISTFHLPVSIELLAMLVIGGAGFPLAPVFGVSFVKLLSLWLIPLISPIFNAFLPVMLPFIESINIAASIQPLLFGTALVLFLILEPRGIAYRWEILRIAWKIRPYSY
jgi:branched-chain amino acid transport system permease protein